MKNKKTITVILSATVALSTLGHIPIYAATPQHFGRLEYKWNGIDMCRGFGKVQFGITDGYLRLKNGSMLIAYSVYSMPNTKLTN